MGSQAARAKPSVDRQGWTRTKKNHSMQVNLPSIDRNEGFPRAVRPRPGGPMPKTLLLADDSVTIQKGGGISCDNEDIEITTVDNGRDAVAKARALRPDIILADVVMPGMSGYEVCETVKADPNLRHIPVLLLTGTFEAFDQARATAVGAAGHVAKPFEAQTLVDRVKQLLATAPGPRASAPRPRPAAPHAPRPPPGPPHPRRRPPPRATTPSTSSPTNSPPPGLRRLLPARRSTSMGPTGRSRSATTISPSISRSRLPRRLRPRARPRAAPSQVARSKRKFRAASRRREKAIRRARGEHT